jgi:phosphatidylglycerol:prolipoprotein diacylglycerol transferase
MIPTILHIGPIPVNSFGLMVALALLVAIERLGLSFHRGGLPQPFAERYVLWAGFTGLIGARFWFIADSWQEVREDLVGALFSSAGFVFYGGFLTAAVVLFILLRRDGVSPIRFFDAVGPCLALGYAIGRLGCQLSGDGDYGMVTDSWWGMSYSSGVVPTPPGVLVYPTPFFESAVAVVIAMILGSVEVSKRAFWSKPCARAGLCLALLSLERFFVEFLRINPRIAGGVLSEAQVIALVLLSVGVVLLIRPHSHSSPAGVV